MKKLITLSLALAFVLPLFAQDSTKVKKPAKKDWSKVSLANRPNDHFMLQLGYNGWSGQTDSVSGKGIPRSFNMYFMFDFPFKSDPRLSVGIGVGLGTDNFYLNKQTVDLTGRSSSILSFRKNADSSYFKKYKLATTYLELPVELRFAADPTKTNSTWKAAIGGKIGTMLSAMTKGKNLTSSTGATLYTYTEKEKSKRYFNTTRLSVTGRISKGCFGIYANYQVNQFVKDGYGPDIRPFQVGLVISGL